MADLATKEHTAALTMCMHRFDNRLWKAKPIPTETVACVKRVNSCFMADALGASKFVIKKGSDKKTVKMGLSKCYKYASSQSASGMLVKKFDELVARMRNKVGGRIKSITFQPDLTKNTEKLRKRRSGSGLFPSLNVPGDVGMPRLNLPENLRTPKLNLPKDVDAPKDEGASKKKKSGGGDPLFPSLVMPGL